MKKFQSFRGKVTMINDFWVKEDDENLGCFKLMTLEDSLGGIVNFVVSPHTYFVDHVLVYPNDVVTGFYDANVPVPLIYPPQYRAIVMTRDTEFQNVKVDHFNRDLVSSDNMLKLNITPGTQIILENDQAFNKIPKDRDLIVVYGASTKSIPAQTVPYTVIVMCD